MLGYFWVNLKARFLYRSFKIACLSTLTQHRVNICNAPSNSAVPTYLLTQVFISNRLTRTRKIERRNFFQDLSELA